MEVFSFVQMTWHMTHLVRMALGISGISSSSSSSGSSSSSPWRIFAVSFETAAAAARRGGLVETRATCERHRMMGMVSDCPDLALYMFIKRGRGEREADGQPFYITCARSRCIGSIHETPNVNAHLCGAVVLLILFVDIIKVLLLRLDLLLTWRHFRFPSIMR